MTSAKAASMFTPSLEFHMALPDQATSALLEGALILKHQPDSSGIKMLATSGCKGYQYQKSWLVKGKGCLPPSVAIAPKKYFVSTQRLWLPHVPGVEGSFYAIAPFQVSVKGVLRGDFGIHFDARVPGSLGCCVIRLQPHWDAYREIVEGLREQGHQQIPLTVRYQALTPNAV